MGRKGTGDSPRALRGSALETALRRLMGEEPENADAQAVQTDAPPASGESRIAPRGEYDADPITLQSAVEHETLARVLARTQRRDEVIPPRNRDIAPDTLRDVDVRWPDTKAKSRPGAARDTWPATRAAARPAARTGRDVERDHDDDPTLPTIEPRPCVPPPPPSRRRPR